ncbi:MAG: ATP-binding protein [Candidatus Saganbacteria bacterium]|nr:ATP-binding protein [Candidatus Saganbacteria bacterium]
MFKRLLTEKIKRKMFKGKAIIITGARQTGKTTLSINLIKGSEYSGTVRAFNCDNPTDREMLSDKDFEFLDQLIGDSKIIFIDEGQKVETIGQTLKLLCDRYKKKKQIIVTGSSSINLLDSTQEALTGRKHVYTLFPLSLEEIKAAGGQLAVIKQLEQLLVFGSYPEIQLQRSFRDKIDLLKELSSSYLYKDILEFQQVKNANILGKLIKALALQIGSEVSYNELSNLIEIDKKTIERYIDLLEKNYVVFRLPPYTKNKRREISRHKKVYFYDLGIRNAVINNFNFLDSRSDAGALWENLMVVERLKYRSYHEIYASQYFWRTYDGSEVDLVEERQDKLYGYEFKWGTSNKKPRPPAKWAQYQNSSYQLVGRKDISGFVM